MANKRTGRGTVLLGLLVLIAGIAGAVVLYLLSEQRRDDAVRDLARAPVGCDTTLSFSDTGTFYLYIEHLGTLDRLDGDCETPDEYSRDPDDVPTVEITVRDGTGDALELDRLDEEFTYSVDDSFAGTATRRVEIASTGDFVVTVDSDEQDFVVAVGRDPRDAATTMRLAAVAAGIAGIVLGLGLMLMGVRRGRRTRRISTAYTARPEWPAMVPLPTSPPVMHPPSAQPVPAPPQPGGWPPVQPVGPPVWSPAHTQPSGPQAPSDPAPGPMAPPHVFAPPGMPTVPKTPSTSPMPPPRAPSTPPDANTDDSAWNGRGEGGEVRGDASR